MSRFGKGRKLPGAEFTWDADPNGEPDGAPTPLYPKYTVPRARPLSPRELTQVNHYRALRERFHDGPYYAVLDAASSAAKKGSAARASFDPFHGMPSYSGRYQKKKRALPRMSGRAYVMKFFPRELWPTIQPTFKGDAAGMDGYVPQGARSGVKRGFEDDDEEEEEDAGKRQKNGEDAEGGENGDLLEGEDEEQEEEIIDDDFEDDEDEMGGDYNAEQYFDDGGDDEYGDDGFGDGGGGGEEDTY